MYSRVLFILLIISSGLWLFFTIIEELNPSYTIQDVYVYCGNNPDVLITPRGDNCSQVMNNIYNENENWTRCIIYK